MNTQQLKTILLQEHEREKSISKRNFIIICVVAGIVFIIASFFAYKALTTNAALFHLT